MMPALVAVVTALLLLLLLRFHGRQMYALGLRHGRERVEAEIFACAIRNQAFILLSQAPTSPRKLSLSN